MIEIEEGIEAPARGGSRKYPLERLAVGQSFLLPAETEAERKRAHLSVGAASRRVSKRTGRKFRLEKIGQEQLAVAPDLDPNGKGVGVRCWRVA